MGLLSGRLGVRAGRVQQVLRSASWLTFDYVVRMAVGLVIGVAIARYLGPAQFGLYNLLLSVVAIAGAFAPLAADSIVLRELVKNPERRYEILGSQALLRLGGGAAAYLAAVGAVVWMYPGRADLLTLVVLVAATLLLQPLEAIPVWFQSQLKVGAIVAAKTSAFLALSMVRLALVLAAAPLLAFVLSIAAEAVTSAIGLLLVYRLAGERIGRWHVTKARALDLVRDSWPLLLSGLSSMLYLRLDIIMLSVLRGEFEAGIYSAATRLSEMWYFIPMAVTASVQPVLLKTREANYTLYLERLKTLYAALAWVSILIAAVITPAATLLVVLLFGDGYAQTGPVLAIHVWAAIAVFLGVVSSQFLVAENLVKVSMYRTGLGLLVNAALNLILIPIFGAQGAAAATLVSYFVAAFSLVCFRSTRQQASFMLRAMTPAGLADLPRVARWLRSR